MFGQNFSRIVYIGETDIDENSYFKEYDFYELYDPNKIYSIPEYEKDYGFGVKRYINSLYEINDKKYVVAEEKPSEEELKELIPYCRCRVCTLNWYNISKYFTCRCCVGCLSTADWNVNTNVLKETRKYKDNLKNN